MLFLLTASDTFSLFYIINYAFRSTLLPQQSLLRESEESEEKSLNKTEIKQANKLGF